MRKLATLLLGAIVAVGCMSSVGCKKQTTPLPANAVDRVDATANSILQPAHAFAARISAAVQSTDPNVHIALTPVQLQVLNDLNKALNIADPLEQAYHNNPTSVTASQLQAATAAVTQKLSAAQAQITVK